MKVVHSGKLPFGANGTFTVTEWEPLSLTTMRDVVAPEMMGENQAGCCHDLPYKQCSWRFFF